MPEMGVPSQLQNRAFSDIKMPDSKYMKSEGRKEKNVEKLLNRATGNELKILERGKRHNELGKDEFMRLLAHQLQNQDPMKPTEQNKIMSDMAQLSQLEQLTNMREEIKKLNTNSSVEMKSLAASFLGKKITTQGASVNLKEDGEEAPVRFSLDNPAKKVIVRILDPKGNVISQIDAEDLPKGAQSLSWNGTSLDGTPAARGEYRYAIQAWDESFMPINIQTKSTGVITEVDFEGGEPIFKVGSNRVSLRDVTSFASSETHPSESMDQAAGLPTKIPKKLIAPGAQMTGPLPQGINEMMKAYQDAKEQ